MAMTSWPRPLWNVLNSINEIKITIYSGVSRTIMKGKVLKRQITLAINDK